MNDARCAIEEMSAAVCAYLRSSKPEEISPKLVPDLLVLERSIKAKLHMAEHHAALLSRATLEKLGRVVDALSDSSKEPVTIIEDENWSISIKSPLAGTLIRYMSFSVAVSSCVNAADTLGRYIHRAYEMENATELKLKLASLKRIQSVLREPCLLNAVLGEPPGLSWMKKVRDLRGECQHGGLAGTHYENPNKSSEPLVLPQYCEDDKVLTISEYLRWTMHNTSDLIAKTARVIAANPKEAVKLKR